MTEPNIIRCAQCGAVLPSGARICPLCGARPAADIPDEISSFSQTSEASALGVERRQTRYFPHWLYKTGVTTLIISLAALPVSFLLLGVGGVAVFFLLLIAAGTGGVFGCLIIFIAYFGPWPLKPL